MSSYLEVLASMKQVQESRRKTIESLAMHHDQLVNRIEDYNLLEEAQKALSVISEQNTSLVLDFITGVINQTLGEVFKGDSREIRLSKSLRAGRYVHINVELVTSEGKTRDLTLQSGTGLRQIISFLYVVSLIEIRHDRKLLMMDEILSGVHSAAKAVLVEIMKIFAAGGWQFVMVEYGVDDLGKIYHVEKPGTEARVYALEDNQKYSASEIYMFTPGLTSSEEPEEVLVSN